VGEIRGNKVDGETATATHQLATLLHAIYLFIHYPILPFIYMSRVARSSLYIILFYFYNKYILTRDGYPDVHTNPLSLRIVWITNLIF